ncbi:type I phosphodiesterase/nucleotide pyrophosphatase family protein [Luminiphilus syltensis NOR5-1B]|uniref:Type I phosphodiesterase/nucleotide pyrophosphatase family protein n=1 Tax=Luminiphilus syltensis NOR5-1B TaxID=565045 RepID=B8KRD8_9GAMM|nr:alkaline phosphatase family protein [Luminiphilus syltensis]EED34511.1 type I phosphodiesterase/nucleotide pyrophosphatase family protein [Luminiphilus syltensis NOR5-1B]
MKILLRKIVASGKPVAAFFLCLPLLAFGEPPRLVLQITVDQLRADLPSRYYTRFGEGGFRYLYENGIRFVDAQHAHANTETIVGHTTLATGAHPAMHGMIGNLWFDRETGFTTYNVEDARYPLLTAGSGVDKDQEIDPTQRAARSDGRSPAAIEVTTFADELRASNGGQSRAVGVSVKDRGAISMAGHSGTAYWFSKASGEFVTSRYYMDEYPAWVTRFNAGKPASDYAGTAWTLLEPKEDYLFADSDDRAWETDVGGFGRVFPHQYGNGSSPYFTTWLTLSPAGDRLVLDFAKQALVEEALGTDATTDYLSVSFSSTDYVGHVFGPSSLEAEDNILNLDRRLAELFAFVDETVGLEHTLIVLSADHGGPDAPGYLKAMSIPADYVDPDRWDSQEAISRIKARFGIEGKLIETYEHPYIYFTTAVKQDPTIDLAQLESAVVQEVSAFSGVALAVSSSHLRTGDVPDTPIHRAMLRNFHPRRSGDVFVVFRPNHFINDFDGLTVASTHGSPWPYDTSVPLVFAGHQIEPCTVEQRVWTVDVAPMLANYLDIKKPSGAIDAALSLAIPECVRANLK